MCATKLKCSCRSICTEVGHSGTKLCDGEYVTYHAVKTGPVQDVSDISSSEVIAGFLISVWINVPLLESGNSSLQLSADVACYSLLLVGICTYIHYGDNVVDALINDANKSASSHHIHIEPVIGTSCLSFCL
jgi:hypothetical protein